MLSAQELEHTRTRLAHLSERLTLLEEENRWLKSQLFGRSSERRPVEIAAEQARLFNEVEALASSGTAAAATITIPAHERKQRGRKRLAAELARVEIVHDLPEEQKICALDGTRLERIGEETAEQLDFVPARARVLKHIRPKYSCPCCRQGVKIAAVPAQLLPKSQASPSLLAHITTAKYVDALPLHRQEAQFARLGVHLPRATMAHWMIKLGGECVVPIINLLTEHLLESPLLQCDETRVQVLRSNKAPDAEHWIWVRASGPPGRRIVLFSYDPSRGATVPMRLLDDFHGILQTDGYGPYAAVAEAKRLVHAGCWAHVRRKFEDARKAQPDPSAHSRARSALDLIGKLYRLERELKELSPLEKLRARQERSAPIVGEIKTWLDSLAGAILPQSALGKAVHYALAQWSKLTRFLEHAAIPLDTNRVENAIRPFVIGRRNWLFSDTQRGAAASANLYSLIETAKANGIEPHAYLTHLFTQLPAATSVEHFESLLPWNVTLASAASR